MIGWHSRAYGSNQNLSSQELQIKGNLFADSITRDVLIITHVQDDLIQAFSLLNAKYIDVKDRRQCFLEELDLLVRHDQKISEIDKLEQYLEWEKEKLEKEKSSSENDTLLKSIELSLQAIEKYKEWERDFASIEH